MQILAGAIYETTHGKHRLIGGDANGKYAVSAAQDYPA